MNQLIVALWWVGFWTAVGLCFGSFLNVIIYRLPRDKSLRNPLWSACPACESRIRWYDNLPILSFILLRGRCRDCHAPIATRYIVIEAMMALVVLMLLDAFFVAHIREGLTGRQFGLSDQLSYDWPIFVAHIVLFASLLSMSCIDLEHYWVDVRFINVAALAGFVLHSIWTPNHSSVWPRPSDEIAIMSLFAMVALGLTWLAVRVFFSGPDIDEGAEFDSEPGQPREEVVAPEGTAGAGLVESRPQAEREALLVSEPDSLPPTVAFPGDVPEVATEPRPRRGSRILGWAAVVLLAAGFVLLVAAETHRGPGDYAYRLLAPLVLFFVAIVSESTVRRAADQEIVDAIHEERHGARRMVLVELALLVPAVGLAAVGHWIMRNQGDTANQLREALHWDTRIWSVAMLRNWTPLVGLATAASGYVVAGALGWLIRIVFTLAFGKEAFGTGDIHLIAAAGSVAGWPVAVLGFFFAFGLALIGWILALPFKRARALPLGPWLALAILAAVLFYDRFIQSPWVSSRIDALRYVIF